MIRDPQEVYLRKRAVSGPWLIQGCPDGGFAGAVVIPALAEHDSLFATLSSLAANPPELLARFLVLVVVNHRSDACRSDKENNLRTLGSLAAGTPGLQLLNLSWIDAASPELEMPLKGGGVGLARKIGLDLALARLDRSGCRPILVCLDADTLVEPSYLSALDSHFRKTPAGGAIIPFRHRQGSSPAEQHAIVCYELYLRHYVLGLRVAGSPYAFSTVGSAMACTAEAYVRGGGMNTRPAGEDFYFLQQLFRTGGVARVGGTVVYPSPRPSHRVPFGTGRSVSRKLAGDAGAITFYRPECFGLLGSWLTIMKRSLDRVPAAILGDAGTVSPHLAEFLGEQNFAAVWEGLRRTNPDPGRLLTAFHGWFDGLKTMKLIHWLSARGFPRCTPGEAIPGLLHMAGVPIPADPDGQLALLQTMEDELDEQ